MNCPSCGGWLYNDEELGRVCILCTRSVDVPIITDFDLEADELAQQKIQHEENIRLGLIRKPVSDSMAEILEYVSQKDVPEFTVAELHDKLGLDNSVTGPALSMFRRKKMVEVVGYTKRLNKPPLRVYRLVDAPKSDD